MTLNSITTTATTSKIWIKPPAVYEVAIPSAHSTNRITHNVQSTLLAPYRVFLIDDTVCAARRLFKPAHIRSGFDV
jgi:hypothetical protein